MTMIPTDVNLAARRTGQCLAAASWCQPSVNFR